MDVEDDVGLVLDGIKEKSGDTVVFANTRSGNTKAPSTAGQWVDITFDPGTFTTTFEGTGSFLSHYEGWYLQPDAKRSTYLEIVSAGGSFVTVKGDASNLAFTGDAFTPADFYTVVWPVGIDPFTGANHQDPCPKESRYNWANGLYISPVMGFDTGSAIEGAQPGTQQAGSYYFWNRYYDVQLGRWNTPDPAAVQPNLLSYVSERVMQLTDPTGLKKSGALPQDWTGQIALLEARQERVDKSTKRLSEIRFDYEISNCNESQKNKLIKDLSASIRAIGKALYLIEKLRAGEGTTTQKQRFANNFLQSRMIKNIADSDYETVEGVLEQMLDEIDGDTIEIECNCCKGNKYEGGTAWAQPGILWDHLVFCPGYFKLSDGDRSFVMTHELSHEFGDTDDEGYIRYDSSGTRVYKKIKTDWLGRRVKDKDGNFVLEKVVLDYEDLQDNADSYAGFVHDWK